MFFKQDSEFDLKIESGGNRRNAYRIEIPGLKGCIEGEDKLWPVKDLSPTGIALALSDEGIESGDAFLVSLYHGGEKLLGDLPIKVVRIGNDFIGCEFAELALRQSDALHEIILKEQKRRIDEKKEKGAD